MRIEEIEMISPKTIEECLVYLQESGRNIRLLAGGTDAVVQMKEGKGRPHTWLNLRGLKELRYIKEVGEDMYIGALTTHQDIANSVLLLRRSFEPKSVKPC